MSDIFSLKERHNIEETFHNNWAKNIEIDSLLVEESFEADTAVENRAAIEIFGNLRGKRILDLGCGAGETSVYFAMKGGDVFAVDISEEMLKRVNRLSDKYKVKLKTFKMEAENLIFENEYFDFIFGNGVLHHLDIKLSMMEISRVLKKGGIAIFIEPLGYNPIINIYRRIAKEVRTKTETPFKYKHITYMKDYFSKIKCENYWLLSLLIFVYMYIIERVDPSVDRYWKRIIRENEKYKNIFKFFFRLDEIILKIFPFLGRFCWNILIVLQK